MLTYRKRSYQYKESIIGYKRQLKNEILLLQHRNFASVLKLCKIQSTFSTFSHEDIINDAPVPKDARAPVGE